MPSKKTKVAMEIGAGLLAAAGAGYYFYAAKDSKKHRSAATSWAKGLKVNALKEVKKMKNIDEKTVKNAIDMASKMYTNVKTVNKVELAEAVKELKKNWQTLSSEAKGGVQSAKKIVKGSAKKAVSTVKKSAHNMKQGSKMAVKTASVKKAAPRKK